MNLPADLHYTNDHEWARLDGEVVTIGITDYAQGELGDIIFVELPQAGITVAAGESIGTIEAVKTVSDIFAPISGELVETNGALADRPEVINSEPYGGGWIVKIKVSDVSEMDQLLSAEEYQNSLE